MRQYLPWGFLLLAACSSEDDAVELTPSSPQSVIEAEANSIEEAAKKAAALVEADAAAEIAEQKPIEAETAVETETDASE